MSLHIYIAHSGEHLLADPVAFASYVFPSVEMRGDPAGPLLDADACSHCSPQSGGPEIMDRSQYLHSTCEADLDDCPRKECQDPDTRH